MSCLLACQSVGTQSPDGPTPQSQQGVALYLVTSPVNLGADATALDKTPLTLAENALISYDEIESYSADTHTFRFKKKVIEQLTDLSKQVPLPGQPFGLAVDGNVVYYGLFWSPISSFSASYPYIDLSPDSLSSGADFIDLTVSLRTPTPYGSSRPDLRNDTRLLTRLRQDSKLK